LWGDVLRETRRLIPKGIAWWLSDKKPVAAPVKFWLCEVLHKTVNRSWRGQRKSQIAETHVRHLEAESIFVVVAGTNLL